MAGQLPAETEQNLGGWRSAKRWNARRLDRLVENTDADPPASADVVVTPLSVAAGGNLTVSINGIRGLIDKATVTGCGVDTPTSADPGGTPLTTLSFTVTVPIAQAGKSCTLVVRTTLEDASTGESVTVREQFMISVTAAP